MDTLVCQAPTRQDPASICNELYRIPLMSLACPQAVPQPPEFLTLLGTDIGMSATSTRQKRAGNVRYRPLPVSKPAGPQVAHYLSRCPLLTRVVERRTDLRLLSEVVPLARLERARLSTIDFESIASTIPPQGLPSRVRRLAGARRAFKRAPGQSLSDPATILCRRECRASLAAMTCVSQIGCERPR